VPGKPLSHTISVEVAKQKDDEKGPGFLNERRPSEPACATP
jgi:hypothetical protein